ncbi:DUF2726 domain-containing protein [Rubellimicrobium roseum]|uniref:DUF2726 domain-containing protein n=1 Tax=Rubellimicrobium roseum TaxID=687525 RepID=A0A5C4NJ25_9RHOB|nr:DUF2726 domain-containing protein [Rubellimicrobium roseum]TNC73418.1 DUF2726 domain-containing protein [Rubellimicrobium roseum]
MGDLAERLTGWWPWAAAVLLLLLAWGALRRRPGDARLERAREQLRVVQRSGFERVPLLNREEARLLPLLERAAGRHCRVMAQTTLGEVIRPARGAGPEAQAAINSKRIDFAIVDGRGLIVCAVEYQGTGHWQNHAEWRDAVKREALRRAGVPMVEVFPDTPEAEVVREVRRALEG